MDFPPETLPTLASVVLVSLVSLVGLGALLLLPLKSVVPILVALAAGALFGDAFIHLLPESFERLPTFGPLLVLAGIFAFFILERLLRWRHHHGAVEGDPRPLGYMNLAGDGLHNLADGIIIAGAYLTNPAAGLATTVAVLLHEVPQEMGDFAILLHAGFSKRRAVAFNLLSASLAIVGAVVGLIAGSLAGGFVDLTLPIAAGAFIYIAGTDLLPELHEDVNPLRGRRAVSGNGGGGGDDARPSTLGLTGFGPAGNWTVAL